MLEPVKNEMNDLHCLIALTIKFNESFLSLFKNNDMTIFQISMHRENGSCSCFLLEICNAHAIHIQQNGFGLKIQAFHQNKTKKNHKYLHYSVMK